MFLPKFTEYWEEYLDHVKNTRKAGTYNAYKSHVTRLLARLTSPDNRYDADYVVDVYRHSLTPAGEAQATAAFNCYVRWYSANFGPVKEAKLVSTSRVASADTGGSYALAVCVLLEAHNSYGKLRKLCWKDARRHDWYDRFKFQDHLLTYEWALDRINRWSQQKSGDSEYIHPYALILPAYPGAQRGMTESAINTLVRFAGFKPEMLRRAGYFFHTCPSMETLFMVEVRTNTFGVTQTRWKEYEENVLTTCSPEMKKAMTGANFVTGYSHYYEPRTAEDVEKQAYINPWMVETAWDARLSAYQVPVLPIPEVLKQRLEKDKQRFGNSEYINQQRSIMRASTLHQRMPEMAETEEDVQRRQEADAKDAEIKRFLERQANRPENERAVRYELDDDVLSIFGKKKEET